MNKPTASNRSSDPVTQLPASGDDCQTGTKHVQALASSATLKPHQDAALGNLAGRLRHDAALDADGYIARSDTRQYGE